MSIQFSCGSCGRKLKVKDAMAGRTGSCPDCGSQFEVPYDDELHDALPYEEEAALPPPTVQNKRKPCPACGELIVKTAAVCRFCGETFDGRARAGSKRGGGGRGGGVDDDMSTGDWVVAILCSGIGCIAGIVWLIQGKPKGGKMLGVSLLMAVIWNVISVVINAAANGGNGGF